MEKLHLVPLNAYQADCRILEVEPGASMEEIKQAFRDQTKVWHPDRFLHDVRLRKKAEEKIKQISLAYRRLCGVSPYDEPELNTALPASSSDWGIAVFALGRALKATAILITTPLRWLIGTTVTISTCVFQWCHRERRSLAIATSAFVLGFAFAMWLLPRDSESWVKINGLFEKTIDKKETARPIVAQAATAAPTVLPETRSVPMPSPETEASRPPWSFDTNSELTMTAATVNALPWEKNIVMTPFEASEQEPIDESLPPHESVWANISLMRFGGVDDPQSIAHGDYMPVSFVTHPGALYLALAYNDVEQVQIRPEEPNVAPWSKHLHLESHHIIAHRRAEETIQTKHHHPITAESPRPSAQSDESIASSSGITPEKELAERKRTASRVTIKPLRVHRTPSGSVLAPSVAKAVTTYAPRPDYPEGARSRRIAGSGVCVVSVDPVTGGATNASMAESTGSPILDRSVVRTLRTWRFKPGTVSEVSIPIQFTTETENQ